MIDTIYSDPNFLQHYGVKGMKWGVRKDNKVVKAFKKSWNNQLGVKAYKGVKRVVTKQPYKKSNYAKTRKLSDQELRTRINRLQMEKQYRDLLAQDQIAAKAATNSILETYGTAILSNASDTFTTTTGKQLGRTAANAIRVPGTKKKK
jgi:hypothetical protein